ncbi:hypothetical protein AB0L67_41330 [Streptomyces flaveolus]|uniref:hypothetical protein n=1 Tax=Streptomyces flaveolus TaxID=67297 RepID=UPI003440F30A
MLTRRWITLAGPTAAAAVLLAAGTVPAHADNGGTGVGTPGCRGALKYVKVCASGSSTRRGSSGSSGTPTGASSPNGNGKGASDAPKCAYTLLVPQPPDSNLAMREGSAAGQVTDEAPLPGELRRQTPRPPPEGVLLVTRPPAVTQVSGHAEEAQ